MLEVAGIPMSVRDNILEQKVCYVIQEIGVDICDQACYRLRDKDRTIVNLPTEKIVFKF